MTVAVVVINYNGTGDTLECIRSLLRVTCPGVRIYVVDNGSDPPLRPALEVAGVDVRLFESGRNLGFTGGNNLGARVALEEGADSVLFLNNDTVVAPGFLEPLVRALVEDSGLGIVTPKISFYGQERIFWAHGARVGRWTARSPHIGVYEKDTGQYDHIREVERVTGCAMLARRALIERVGLLDDRFFIYSEELDWCLRSRRAGWRLAVIKDSVIWHKGHRDSGRIGRPFIARLQTRNHLLMLRKNSNYFVAGGVFALAYFMLSLLAHLAHGLLGWTFRRDRRYRDYMQAHWDGMVDCWRGRFGRPALR